MNRKLFFAIGFSVWLVATIMFRLAGELFFRPDDVAALALLWLLSFAAMLLLARALFRWRKLRRAEQFEAAVLLVISGMFLDAFITQSYGAVFPNMPEASAGGFGAWLLLAYSSVLLAAFTPPSAD